MPARKPKPGESFGDLFPEIAKQWHPTKNGDLTPFDVSKGSDKKVWWKCDKGDDHEWITSIGNLSRGTSCPVCTNQKVVLSNCLASTHPEIAKEWHPTKNNGVSPYDVVSGSNKKFWWKCQKGSDHEWEISPNSRTGPKNSKCPICSGYKVVLSNCLASTHPEIAKEWHPTKNNGVSPYDIVSGSNKSYWWRCYKGEDHEWKISASSRTGSKKTSCPICSGHKVVLSNCLASTHPEIAKEWHPTKNGNLTPFDFNKGSGKKVWWRCSKGEDHEWETKIQHRVNGKCPICSGQKVVKSNSIVTTHPEITKEWHPTKNNINPLTVGKGSEKKVWWKCLNGKNHEWQSKINNRTNGNGCPYCTLTPQSREELIITHELTTIFKGINPKGFKTRVKGKLRSIDIYIPDLKLGIEFDGNYWHKDKRALDKLKTEELEAEGFNIIRVRQKPLKRIFEDDVMAEKKYDGKKITNDILIQIMKDYKLGQSTILKINKYIEKPSLQNEKGLEKYIDMILTEKAEKK